MITFETQEAFEEAVLGVIIEKLDISVYLRGHPFVTGVEVAIRNVDDNFGCLISGSDAVA